MSDHISGPRALSAPLADITDFCAFPSPERPGHLVLVQNTYPFAQPDTHFSDGLVYRFRIRSATIEHGRSGSPFAFGNEEYTIDCEFSPAVAGETRRAEQTGVCTASNGLSAPIQVDEIDSNSDKELRAFAGTRWDPFFMDAPAALSTIATQKLAFTNPGKIYLDGKSVLSLIVEVELLALGCDAPLVAVITETLTKGKIPIRMEHVGRPEVKNMMLAPKQFDPVNRDLEIRDLYNMEDVFHYAEAYQGAYRARLDANLAFWDSLDGKMDWRSADSGHHPLTELILTDMLFVDLSKPYQESGSFFEIERSAIEQRPHQTCGGRTPNDDVMDTIFTLMINGGRGEPIRDGVDSASRPAGQTFPYLAPPSDDPPAAPEHH